MSNRSDNKIRFSGLDVLIILGVLGVLGLGFMFFRGGGGGEPVTVHFEVEFQGIRDEIAQMPREGDRVYDSVRGHFLGTLQEIRIEPATVITFNNETRQHQVEETPGFVNVYLMIVAYGYETDDRIVIAGDNVEVRVGTRKFVRGRGYAQEGFVVSLSTRPRRVLL